MVLRLLAASVLVAFCVTAHAVGVTVAVRWLARGAPAASMSFWRETRLFVLLAGWIILLHLVEVVAWALLYAGRGAMPSFQAAAYFSGVTYTTTGYGDLVLPESWRLVGAIEALTGILMCGWSTGFFFLIVSRRFIADSEPRR